MALPTIRPHSAPPSHNRIPASNLRSQVDGATKGVLSILKDTGWPAKATPDVQGFIETMETKLNLQRIPTDDTQIEGELRIAIEHFLRELESVRGRLKEKSRKYDTKKKGLRDEVAIWFSGVKLGDCTEVLTNCRADVERSLTSLNDHLGDLGTNSEQRTSHEVQLNSTKNAEVIVEGSVGDDSGRFPGTPTVPPPTATPAPDAGLEPPQSSAPSSIPSDQRAPAPAGIQLASVTAGKQKESSRRENLLKGAKLTFKAAEGLSGTLPVVGGYLGAVAKVGSTIVEMVQTMDDNNETANKLGTHVYTLSEVLKRVSSNPRQPEESRTTNGIEALRQKLLSVKDEAEALKSQPSLEKFLHSSDQSESLTNLQEQVRTALEEIQLLINVNTSILVDELQNESIQNKHRHLLDRLGDGKYGAEGIAVEDVTCLPGTRIQILERIDDWIRFTGESERVLWIRGMAGKGKSTIASTVAHSWKARACCAIYYFHRGRSPPNSPFLCSLARQLAGSLDPELRDAILSTVEKNENIINDLPDEQFATLFVSSLRALEKRAFPILIIVDALDEWDSVDYAVNFGKLVGRHSASLPDNVKFLLTTRPEAPLIRALEPMNWTRVDLDSALGVDADIERFVRHKLLEVKREHKIEGDWPSPNDISRLTVMAQGLFLWARTVVKYLSNGSPTDRLRSLLQSPTAWNGVDDLHAQILSNAFEESTLDSENQNLLLGLLGTLVTAPYPVSTEVITFLHAEYDWGRWENHEAVLNFLRKEILADLSSLLIIPASPADPIRLMHTSIRDLLVDRRRCKDRPYWVDVAENHQRLASACIRQMNNHLRENICSLPDISKPSSEVQDIVKRGLSKGIQYCCRSWSIHLTEGQQRRESVADCLDHLEADFESFSHQKLLFWLEVMSLLGATSEAIVMVRQICHWLSQQANVISSFSLLAALWDDVRRCLAVCSEPISFGTLHIYASALAHCPSDTELWKYYGIYAKVQTIKGLQASTRPSKLWTRSTSRGIYSVAFSPGRALLALGFSDGTILVCDAQTGSETGTPLIGHTDLVNSVCFSSDGELLASGSDDQTIRLWNPQSGRQIGGPLIGHTDSISSVCFLPGGKLLASGSSDSTIRLWNPHTRKTVFEPLTGHTDQVNSVCFSPDGKLLASGSSDNTIRLWDPQTGNQVGEPLTGHTDWIKSVCFSPDGRLLASGSSDSTIRLWDAKTRRQAGEPLKSHTRQVNSVCFLPDGKLLASGSDDQTICLWDPQTGRQVGEPLTGHTAWVNSVCFSPDGKLLASGSSDRTISTWDPQIWKQGHEPLTGHIDRVNSICFSPDGNLLASGSSDSTICLWNPQTGNQVGEPLVSHADRIRSVCFSQDGELLASGSDDRTIRLWDPRTGKQVGGPLKGRRPRVPSSGYVYPSLNGRRLSVSELHNSSFDWDTLALQRWHIQPDPPNRVTSSSLEDHWVTLGSHRLLWLPPQYLDPRPQKIILSGGKLAVAAGTFVHIFDVSGVLGHIVDSSRIHSVF